MSEDKTGVGAALTPETDSHVSPFKSEFANEIVAAHFARKLERERDEARRGFERMSDTCFAAIRRAELAEKERDEARVKCVEDAAKLCEEWAKTARDGATAELQVTQRMHLKAQASMAEIIESKIRKLAPLPSGYCVVPLEPTDKMAQAAWDIQTIFNPQAVKAMYKAMLAARK